MRRALTTSLLALGIATTACAGDDETSAAVGDPDYVRDPALNVDLTSDPTGASSHNVGKNCMECHQEHGPGRGLFTVAGTVYAADGLPKPGHIVELRTAPPPDGTVVISVPTDTLGNYYTTASVPFPDTELFPVVRDAQGAQVQMPFPVSSGACNFCHNPLRRVPAP